MTMFDPMEKERIHCLKCNKPGLQSIYALDGQCGPLCTRCANKLRFDGLHIVDRLTITTKPKKVTHA